MPDAKLEVKGSISAENITAATNVFVNTKGVNSLFTATGNNKATIDSLVTATGNIVTTFEASTGNLKAIQDSLVTATGNLLSVQDSLVTATGNINTTFEASTGNLKAVQDSLVTATGNNKATIDSLVTATGNNKATIDSLVTATGNNKATIDSLVTATGNILNGTEVFSNIQTTGGAITADTLSAIGDVYAVDVRANTDIWVERNLSVTSDVFIGNQGSTKGVNSLFTATGNNKATIDSLVTATGNLLAVQDSLVTATGNINTTFEASTGNLKAIQDSLVTATGNNKATIDSLVTATGNILDGTEIFSGVNVFNGTISGNSISANGISAATVSAATISASDHLAVTNAAGLGFKFIGGTAPKIYARWPMMDNNYLSFGSNTQGFSLGGDRYMQAVVGGTPFGSKVKTEFGLEKANYFWHTSDKDMYDTLSIVNVQNKIGMGGVGYWPQAQLHISGHTDNSYADGGTTATVSALLIASTGYQTHMGGGLHVTTSGKVAIGSSGDVNTELYVSGSVSAHQNISAAKYYGDGSTLDNLPSGGGGGGSWNVNTESDGIFYHTLTGGAVISGSVSAHNVTAGKVFAAGKGVASLFTATGNINTTFEASTGNLKSLIETTTGNIVTTFEASTGNLLSVQNSLVTATGNVLAAAKSWNVNTESDGIFYHTLTGGAVVCASVSAVGLSAVDYLSINPDSGSHYLYREIVPGIFPSIPELGLQSVGLSRVNFSPGALDYGGAFIIQQYNGTVNPTNAFMITTGSTEDKIKVGIGYYKNANTMSAKLNVSGSILAERGISGDTGISAYNTGFVEGVGNTLHSRGFSNFDTTGHDVNVLENIWQTGSGSGDIPGFYLRQEGISACSCVGPPFGGSVLFRIYSGDDNNLSTFLSSTTGKDPYIGIGTELPTSKLAVDGDVSISGNLTLNPTPLGTDENTTLHVRRDDFNASTTATIISDGFIGFNTPNTEFNTPVSHELFFKHGNKQKVTLTSTVGIMRSYMPDYDFNGVVRIRQSASANSDGLSGTISAWKIYNHNGVYAGELYTPAGTLPVISSSTNDVSIVSFYWDAEEQRAYGMGSALFLETG